MRKLNVNQSIFTLAILFVCSFTFAQSKIYYPAQKQNTDLYAVEISNIVGMANEIKFKIEIENTSSEFLLFDASKCVFTINGATVTPKDKFVIIEPYKKKSKTLVALGSGFESVREFKFELNGIQQVIPSDDKFATEPFPLPPSKNDFSVGDFTVDLKNYKKVTGSTTSKFEVQYKGKKLGFVHPAKITVSMPDGKDYANAKKSDPILLFPGDKESFNANWDRMPGGSLNDMQKVEMILNFTNVFGEATATDVPAQNFDFSWDEALTTEKNK